MATRNTRFVSDEHYHVYNRGNSKQSIFLDDGDYERFVSLLFLSNSSRGFNLRDELKGKESFYEVDRGIPLLEINSFCLMPNHFHLVITPLVDGGMSQFMLKLGTAYSMYFNKKYERTGSLFEGSFKAKHIDSDEYLKYLFSYVHLNPLSTHIESERLNNTEKTRANFEKVANYKYSSLTDYLHQDTSPRVTLGLVETGLYRGYFRNKDDIKKELFDWLEYEDSALGLP